MKATGEFEVNLQPLDTFAISSGEVGLGRMGITKTFSGDLAGTSLGEMLTARTGIPDSAGYVAIEQVAGALHGQRGSFMLQHYGVLMRGLQRLILEIVPDSGAGELEGIRGSMVILITGGKHYYELDYSLEAGPEQRERQIEA